MGAIFISYRRDDAEGQAGRLYDDLVKQFGEDGVFMDVTDIEAGRDFRQVIDQHVASCGVLLAVIGKDWIDSRDAMERRRLDDPNDFVRLEVASALKRDIPVIPVLVRGASMPRAEQLPPDCQDLCYRNGVELTHPRWDSDVQVLIKALSAHVKIGRKASAGQESASVAANNLNVPAKPRLSRLGWSLLAGLIVLTIAATSMNFLLQREDSPKSPAKNYPIAPPPQVITAEPEIKDRRDQVYVCKLNPEGDNFLSLRAGPDSSYPEILRMGANTLLKVVDVQGPWNHVRMRDGTMGWANSRWLCQGSPK